MKISFIILFIFFQSITGQEIKEDVTTLLVDKELNINLHGDSFDIYEKTKKIDQFHTVENLSKANETVFSSTFNKVSFIEAKTINIDNGKQKEYYVKDITESDIVENSIFYSGSKKKNISFSNIQPNSITELNYKKRIKDPHFLPSTIFTSNKPIKEYRLKIIFSEKIDLGYKIINAKETDFEFIKEKVGVNFEYTWIIKNLPKTNRNYDFSPLYYVPQIIPFIKSYDNKGEKINLLRDVSDLYKWYYGFTCNINKQEQEKVKIWTQELVGNLTDEEEIIKKIYYEVQNSINYIAFEDGMNGFIPRDASSIFENKYGDCKDMSNLLCEMLNYAGIEAHLTWIGTRRKPYSYYNIATPIVDNHMITTVINKQKDTVFLDATAKYLSYPNSSPFTQGKEALVGISKDEYRIIKVPETDAQYNTLSIKNSFVLNGKEMLGIHAVDMLGYEKLYALHSLKNRDQSSKDFVFDKLKIGKRKSQCIKFTVTNKELSKDTLKIKFNSITKNVVNKIGNDLYLRASFDNFLSDELVKNEEKKFDKKVDFKNIRRVISKIKIPENFKVKFVPKPTKIINDKYSFLKEYSVDGDIISIKKEIKINSLRIKVDEIFEWNNFIKSTIKANKESIVLTQKN